MPSQCTSLHLCCHNPAPGPHHLPFTCFQWPQADLAATFDLFDPFPMLWLDTTFLNAHLIVTLPYTQWVLLSENRCLHMRRSLSSLIIREMKTKTITSHLPEWLKLTTQETTGIGENEEKGEPSYPGDGNANRCSHSGK